MAVPTGTRDWGKVTLQLSLAAANLSTGSVISGLESFKKAVDAFCDKTFSTDELATLLWYETAIRAVADALRRNEAQISIEPPEVAKRIQHFVAQSLDDELPFGSLSDLLNPAGYGGAEKLHAGFKGFLEGIDADLAARLTDQNRRDTLNASLKTGLLQAWTDDIARYRPVLERLEGPIRQNALRADAWLRHRRTIQMKFDEFPVFYAEDKHKNISIADVYVPLRSYYLEIEYEESEDGRFTKTETRRTAHVNDLHDAVLSWLDGPVVKRDSVRLIAGGPGSGKSSFARALASDLSRWENFSVLFIELQRMSLSGDIEDCLNTYLKRRDFDGEGLQGMPLDWEERKTKPLLIIFDGLDELARDQDGATDLAKKFVQDAKRLVEDYCEADKDVRALILGRSPAMTEARKAANIPSEKLLHVLPLRPPSHSDMGLDRSYGRASHSGEEEERFKLSDPRNLVSDKATQDQRPLYWQNWQTAIGEPDVQPPAGLYDPRLADLTAEPLLMHLLIISGKLTEDDWQAAADNRNLIYEEIFAKIHQRDQSKDTSQSLGLKEPEFFPLMECLGLAAWENGGRTGDDASFKRIREAYCNPALEKKFERMRSTDLKGVAMQFYTREDVNDRGGYEFIHKSFGEYLTARALVKKAVELESIVKVVGEKVALENWLGITARNQITVEIIDFVRGEMRRRAKGGCGISELKENLENLMNAVLRDGMPIQEKSLSFREIEAQQRHAEGSFLAVLNACTRAIAEGAPGTLTQLDWQQDADAARKMIERLGLTRAEGGSLRTCLSHMDFSTIQSESAVSINLRVLYLFGFDFRHCNLNGADLSRADLFGANLIGANLSESDLIGANLRGANLRGANLRGANLFGADLIGANLSESDLIGADLRGANLFGANLIEANLRGANLIEANLRGANLSRADLSRADLSEANLNEANLHGADLIRANLREADLSRADLREADLSRADLNGADLREVNLSEAKCSLLDIDSAKLHFADCTLAEDLTQSQIDSADGNSETKLPPGLIHPAHWAAVDGAGDV